MFNTPLSPVDLLEIIRRAVEQYCQAHNGYCSIAGDPGEIIEALTESPQGFRVVLAWQGDYDETGQAQAGITTQQFEAWIFKAKGLPLQAGEGLVQGPSPFLKVISDLRAVIRAIQFPQNWTNLAVLYKGAAHFDPVLVQTITTAGYKLNFELIAAIPRI